MATQLSAVCSMSSAKWPVTGFTPPPPPTLPCHQADVTLATVAKGEGAESCLIHNISRLDTLLKIVITSEFQAQ